MKVEKVLRMEERRFAMRGTIVAAVCFLVVAVACYGAEKKGPAPVPAAGGSVLLYDTMVSAEVGERVSSLVAEGKWKQVGEGAKPGSFSGDAVLVNNRLAALIRRDGGGVELYARGGSGWVRRARVMPAEKAKALRISDLKATANDGTDAAVRVAVEGGRGMVFSMNAGDPMLKAAVAEGKVECLRVEAGCRFGVLPDFFADDLLVDAKAVAVDRTEVPSDNFFLHMVGNGEAIVAAVWEKNVRDVELSVSGEGEARRIVATDVFYGDQGAIWVAVLEEKGIWHTEHLTKEDSEKGKTLDKWEVPFMAKWKANFTRDDGSVSSAPLVSGKGATGFAGMRYAQHNHMLTDSRAGKGKFTASLVPEAKLAAGYITGSTYAGPMVAYPIARFDTPIEQLCVEDLLVRCLGAGPCAYVLDVEAAKPIYKGIFTCSYGKTPGMFIPAGPSFDANLRAAETWKEDRAFMKNETRAVATFIKFIQDRINTYLDLIAELLAYLDQAEKKHPKQSEFIGRLRKELTKPTQVFGRAVPVNVRANGEAIFAPWMAEMMKAMRVDTAEQAAKGFAAAKAPEIGDPQDARVAGLRLKVKVVRSMATMEMARNPAAAEIAREIRKRIEAALRNPSNYERETQWVSGG